MKPSRTTAKKLFGGLFAALRVRFSIYVLPSEQTPQAWFSHFHASRALIFTLVAALTINPASAQQTITYTNGGGDISGIVITSATNPTTLYIASGTANQLGVISDSGTSGVIYKTGAGLLFLTNNNTYAGTTYIDSGTLEVDYAPSFEVVGGSIYSPDAYIFAGLNSGDNGTLLINEGGQVTEADGFLGFYSGSIGTATVTGTGGNAPFLTPSSLNISAGGGLFVGDGGQGTLNIEDGGHVNDSNGLVGTSSGSSGTATVTGSASFNSYYITASTWSNSGYLTVGDYGTGTLNIQNGGIVQVGTGAGTVTLAQNSGSIGTLNIGNGSLAGTLQAGTVTGGAGMASVVFGESDASYTFAPNLTGSLSVTQSGTGTTILTGANTYTGGTTINQGTLAVSGAGASINSQNEQVFVGYKNGDNGTLLISNGGLVFGSTDILGNTTSSSGTATVTGVNANGASSTWNNNGLYVGWVGAGLLNIQDGGRVTDYSGGIGDNEGSTGTATVTGINADGSASTWSTIGGNLNVGDEGQGTLNIADGGQVTDAYGNLGIFSGSSGTTTVTGVNANGTASTWSNNRSLTVGFDGAGTLNIQNGGIVQVDGGGGVVTLGQNAGSIGTLNIGNGGLAGTVQAGTVTGGVGTASVVFGETDASYTFAPNLTGSLSVTQSGSGTTILTGTNTYTGGTTLAAGILQADSATALGTGTIGFTGGTLQYGAGITQDFSSQFSTAPSQAYRIDTKGQNITFATAFTSVGNSSLTKTGAGTLTLAAAVTLENPTTIDFGTLEVAAGGSLNEGLAYVGYNSGDNGTLLISNGGHVFDQYTGSALGLSSGSQGTATVTGVNANGTASTWGAPNQDNTLFVGYAGTGTLNISDGGQVYIGGDLGRNAGSIGTATVTGINATGTASTWNVTAGLEVGDSGTGILNIQDGGQVTGLVGILGEGSGSSGTATVTGVNANGTASIWSNSNGLVVGDGGTGTLNIEDGGVVQVGGGTGTLNLAYGAGSTGTLNIGNGGLAGTVQAGTVTGGAGTASVVFGETDASYTFAPNLTGSLSVTQSGSGTTILTGANTYTGGTTVSAGTLAVNGSVTGNIAVNSGGTLGGNGTIDGKITVASGGSTYPGDPQILTASSAEYQNGSTAQFAIATTNSSSHPPTPGVDYDQIKLTSGAPQSLLIDPGTTTLQLNLSSTSLAALQANASNNIPDLYFVFDLGSGTSTGQFSDLTLTEGANTYTDAITDGTATFAQLGLQFKLSYTASESNHSLLGGNDVAFDVEAAQSVPEPSTWALLLGGCGILAFWRRCTRTRTRRTLL